MLRLGAPLVVLAIGCGADASPGTRSFEDESGRSCTVDLQDISATAECDADPATIVVCAEGVDPCFAVSPDVRNGVVRNCAACCNTAEHETSFLSDDCVPIVCAEDGDCPVRRGACAGGVCTEP